QVNPPPVCPSTPGAPLLALTRQYVSHTSHFEISNDFPCDTDLPTPPCQELWLIEQTTLDGPAPSLHPHYRGFITTTNRSASTPRVGTQHLAVSAAWCSSSYHPKPCGRRYQGLPSHVPCNSRRPGSRRLNAGHHLASKRVTARLIPGPSRCPSFDVIYGISTLRQRFTCVRLPDPYLTPEGAFSSSLTTHSIQPTQHEAV